MHIVFVDTKYYWVCMQNDRLTSIERYELFPEHDPFLQIMLHKNNYLFIYL